jgi:hypothetical protein
MVALRQDEWDELTPAEKKQHLEDEAKNVFGHDHKKDRHGKPIEQGIGSPGNLSEQHFAALARAESQEVADKARAAAIKAGTFNPNKQAFA